MVSALGSNPPKTYFEGRMWSERPLEHHTISKNASQSAEAQLLVFFIVPHDAKLSVPVSSP